MQVIVNGCEKQIETGETVTALLHRLDVEPLRVAVEINEDVVSRRVFDTAKIHAGDRIEIVTFVGGG